VGIAGIGIIEKWD